ncbi:DHH family phosphoesterase [Fructilactobacillus fructivorans]|uniref:DHH family phosphoesterase n=1 Tax=Fructilactobacillus fructivorans TaxID=1614 RepID=UPI000705218E|nr:bifunctional oligoribonuclease/PAP phosphatase NrnA [Fructilactobacillus fructivorans]KRN42417.1 3(2),5-bisphosphate nucleotidase [Fructilactobacillus fructivorans]
MNVKQQINEKIKEFPTIIIHRHQSPDPDAVGSQLGLANIIKASYPDKKVLTVGKQYQGFDWLGKVTEASDNDYQNALVIVVDTANQPRVDDNRYTKGKYLIKIDHHPNDDQFGDLMWVEPEASSTSELIYDLFAANNDLKMPDNAARLLYAGIIGDTGRFKYSSTSSHTFEVASKLDEYHFSITDVAQTKDAIDVAQARLAAYVYEHLTIDENGAAYVILTNEVIKDLKLGDDSTSSVVPLPGNIGEVVAWAIFVQQKEGNYRIRLRSKGPSINELAKEHDGGGHALASGAKASDDDEIKQVVQQLSEVVKQYKKENN